MQMIIIIKESLTQNKLIKVSSCIGYFSIALTKHYEQCNL